MFTSADPGMRGGLVTTLRRLSQGLHERGHEVHAIFTDISYVHRQSGSGHEWSVPLSIPKRGPWLGALRSAVASVWSLLVLAWILGRVRPDLVYCHFVDVRSTYFTVLRPFFAYKLVLGARGSDVLRFDEKAAWRQACVLETLKQADHFTALSGAIRDEAVRRAPSLGRKSTVIYNGVDSEFWRPSCAPGARGMAIASAGTLTFVKGHDILARAFALVAHEFREATVVVAGEGELRTMLLGLARDLGVADRVEMPGWLGREALRRLLWRTTVFAMPSRSEGMGSALLEAMATGLPVVASRVGGIPEFVVHEETGLLVDPDNPEALAEAIRRMLRSPELRLRLGAGALERAKRLSWKTTLDQYEGVFRGVLRGGAAAGRPSVERQA